MLSRSQRISEASLRLLHPESIDEPQRIWELLDAARQQGVEFHRGLDSHIDLEVATLESVDSEHLILRTKNFETIGSQVFLNFELEDRPYFFATSSIGPLRNERLPINWPSAVFYAERRDRSRWRPNGTGDARRVRIRFESGPKIDAEVLDISSGGMGVRVPLHAGDACEGPAVMEFLDGRDAGRSITLVVRNQRPDHERDHWTRVGLLRSEFPIAIPIDIEFRNSILPEPSAVGIDEGSAWERIEIQSDKAGEGATVPRVVRYENTEGEELVGIIDSYGEPRGAPAILIPSGWGQTKEALLPLARTLVACFAAWDQPVTVLRFDGTRQRGESYNDPICCMPGREYHHFTFFQAVKDIEASLDFLERDQSFRPSASILVTFSIASIAGRKAVARDRGLRIGGWISVVGSPDLQSAIRSISGGVDLAAGYEQGMRFGIQELLGVAVDTDRIGVDSNANRMVFLEDSRRDFSDIHIPVTWFHGEHDAWMDIERVRDVMSQGDTSNRKLISIPTGHQVRQSQHAMDTFQCVASEIGHILFEKNLPLVLPEPRDVRRRLMAEGRRRNAPKIDLRAFWRDYLLGRDRSLGIELMTHAAPYRKLMAQQIRSLDLQSGDRVADLGSGTGSFVLAITQSQHRPPRLTIDELDCVVEGLTRARERLSHLPQPAGIETTFTVCDLDLRNNQQRIPLQTGSVDKVLVSLLLSYVDYPILLLRDIRRILRPGGQLVVSSLCRDADFSRLYVETLAEVRIGGTVADLPEAAGKDLSDLGRNFLNDAAKILELEEAGAFQLWDPEELIELVGRAGFNCTETVRVFGNPPQAVVLCAERV